MQSEIDKEGRGYKHRTNAIQRVRIFREPRVHAQENAADDGNDLALSSAIDEIRHAKGTGEDADDKRVHRRDLRGSAGADRNDCRRNAFMPEQG